VGLKVSTAKEMQNIDKRTIEVYHIPGIVLMENAGLRVVEALEETCEDLPCLKVAVIAGKGNNGGDGFVVARHLENRGVSTRVFLLAQKSDLTGDAKKNLESIVKIGLDIEEIRENDMQGFETKIRDFDILIDAILGTGLHAKVKGYYRDIIEIINRSGKPVVSIDIPSGLSSDTGEVLGEHIRADMTVTFALPKRGHVLYPSAKSVGELRIVDISIPQKAIDEEGINVELLDEEDIRKIITLREPDAHKGTFGHVLVVSGSLGKSGAAGLAGLGALRSGAGLVTLAMPKSLINGIAGSLLEAMTLPLDETKEGTISQKAADCIIEKSQEMDALVVGPGLTIHPDTVSFLKKILKGLKIPVLIDADGINGLALLGTDILKKREIPLILTPHPGEMARLIKKSVGEIQKDRLGAAESFSKKYGLYLALKGAGTVIADPRGHLFINTTGNPGMATAGSGDALSGIIGGFLAQKIDPLDSLKAGVYLHGLAGDIAASELGETSLITGDILDALPFAIKSLWDEEEEEK
jgi:hydroxyethylthiazole kinase-like uncharacterized protein yjeF